MRLFPIGKRALANVLIPIAVPMVVLASLQVPVGQPILTVIKAIMSFQRRSIDSIRMIERNRKDGNDMMDPLDDRPGNCRH